MRTRCGFLELLGAPITVEVVVVHIERLHDLALVEQAQRLGQPVHLESDRTQR